jgi:hypothetical protein
MFSWRYFMVTEEEVEIYKSLLNCIDFTTNLKSKWHELTADLLIEIRDKLDEINKKLEGQ